MLLFFKKRFFDMYFRQINNVARISAPISGAERGGRSILRVIMIAVNILSTPRPPLPLCIVFRCTERTGLMSHAGVPPEAWGGGRSRSKNVTFSPRKRRFRDKSTKQKVFAVVRSLYVRNCVKIDAKTNICRRFF